MTKYLRAVLGFYAATDATLLGPAGAKRQPIIHVNMEEDLVVTAFRRAALGRLIS
jgi:hypothetical protein